MLGKRVYLSVERLDDRDLPAVMGPNVLVPSLFMSSAAVPAQTSTASPGGSPAGASPTASLVAFEILESAGPLLAIRTPALPTLPATPIVPSADTSTTFSAALTAQSIALQTAASSSHLPGVEIDLSPLAEAPEGIVVYDSVNPFARNR